MMTKPPKWVRKLARKHDPTHEQLLGMLAVYSDYRYDILSRKQSTYTPARRFRVYFQMADHSEWYNEFTLVAVRLLCHQQLITTGPRLYNLTTGAGPTIELTDRGRQVVEALGYDVQEALVTMRD
jgi:hypothetical protein